MAKHAFPTDCPCQSGKPYKDCCFMYHMEKQQPPTAEALMRSRYAAYVLKKADYLLYSWHPDTRPAELDLDGDAAKWVGLAIVATEAGGPDDDEGTVEFVARYKIGGRAAKLAEKSRFVRFKGRWVYLDGLVDE
ncbi:YchJ family protein [Chitinimonas koreensis]|uniref:YchJ family protein n=1 Tax=Chitinimonas koreensis TaxID=356302 RepID=UPI0004149DD4|nr:YchJ family protein [Chitinimonas koreensis]QNM98013.1 YchJ family protein [Chitinimonas koreensis]